MDRDSPSISPRDLYERLGSEAAPMVVDVRRDKDFLGAERVVVPPFQRSPDRIEEWRNELPRGRTVVTYCAHGEELSQGIATALRMAPAAEFFRGRMRLLAALLATVTRRIRGNCRRRCRHRHRQVAQAGGPGGGRRVRRLARRRLGIHGVRQGFNARGAYRALDATDGVTRFDRITIAPASPSALQW